MRKSIALLSLLLLAGCYSEPAKEEVIPTPKCTVVAPLYDLDKNEIPSYQHDQYIYRRRVECAGMCRTDGEAHRWSWKVHENGHCSLVGDDQKALPEGYSWCAKRLRK